MSIQRPNDPAATLTSDPVAAAAANDPFNTALIGRLANEYFSESRGAGLVPTIAPSVPSPAPSFPTTAGGLPAHAPGVPARVPTALPSSPEAAAPAGNPGLPGVPVSESAPEFSTPEFSQPEIPAVPTNTDRQSAIHNPQSNESSLTGGFPLASSNTAPPVHPSVVAAEPEPATAKATPSPGTPVGAHKPGSEDSYEFGEPRSNGKVFGNLVPEVRPVGPVGENKSLFGFPAVDEEPATDFYFIRSRDISGPAIPGGTPRLEGSRGWTAFDVEGVRRDFPALHQKVNGKPLIWLDNAATTQKPQSVIDATSRFYSRDNSNIHRAAHTLAARSTELFESGREKVRQFLGASDAKEIVFVRGTTEAINLVAQTYGKQNIGPGDEIILTRLEHHANIVPWQLLAQQTGAVIRPAPINDRGELILEEYAKLFGPRTKFVSATHVSNALGTITPIQEIIGLAHSHGVPVLVDGAQSTPHIPINVQALAADFFVFSGHKIFGPTGIGALYGKSHLLESIPPWQGGGHMIRDVTFEKTTFQGPPEKFEAGTPDIAGVVGLGAAIDYLLDLGLPAIAAYEHALLDYATEAMQSVPGIRPIGTAATKASVFGFVIPGIPNDKIARHLDKHGIAVRAGHHCAQPAVRSFGVESTVRPSLAFYNTREEIDQLVYALQQLPRTSSAAAIRDVNGASSSDHYNC
ncbi:MAG TPA: SufS family cysteine desulfurase [Chthoniobacterales bacterium]